VLTVRATVFNIKKSTAFAHTMYCGFHSVLSWKSRYFSKKLCLCVRRWNISWATWIQFM